MKKRGVRCRVVVCVYKSSSIVSIVLYVSVNGRAGASVNNDPAQVSHFVLLLFLTLADMRSLFQRVRSVMVRQCDLLSPLVVFWYVSHYTTGIGDVSSDFLGVTMLPFAMDELEWITWLRPPLSISPLGILDGRWN